MDAENIARSLGALLWSIRLYWLVILIYALAWGAYVAELRGVKWPAGKLAPLLWLGGVALHALFVVVRTRTEGWLPLVTGYDRSAVLALALAACYAGYERRAGNHLLGLAVPPAVVLVALAGQVGFDPLPFATPAIYRHPWYSVHAVLLLIAATLAGFSCAAELLPVILGKVMRLTRQREALVDRFRPMAERLADRCLALAFPLLLAAIGSEGMWHSATMGTIWLWEWTGTWGMLAAVAYSFYYHLRRGLRESSRLLAALNAIGFLLIVVSLAGIPGQGLPGFPS